MSLLTINRRRTRIARCGRDYNILKRNHISAPLLMCAVFLIIIIFHAVILSNETQITQNEILEESDVKINSEFSAAQYESMIKDEKYVFYNGNIFSADQLFITIILMYICAFVLPGIFYIRLKKNIKFNNINIEFLKFGNLKLIISAIFLIIFSVITINSLFFYFTNQPLTAGRVAGNGGYLQNIEILIAFVIFPAVAEEFIFRLLLPHEYDVYGYICSVFATSLFYAAGTFSLSDFPVYFLTGIVIYAAVKITGCIFTAVILRLGFGLYMVFINDVLISVMNHEQNRFMFLFIASALCILSLILFLSSAERIFYKKAYQYPVSDDEEIQKRRLSTSFSGIAKMLLSPGFLLAVVIYFTFLLSNK